MHNQVLPSIESVDGSDPLATLQNPMARLEAKEEEDEDEDEDSEDEEEEDGEDTDLDDWEPDPPRPFDPHDLCKRSCFSGAGWAPLLGLPVQTLLSLRRRPFPSSSGSRGGRALSRHPRRPGREGPFLSSSGGRGGRCWLLLELRSHPRVAAGGSWAACWGHRGWGWVRTQPQPLISELQLPGHDGVQSRQIRPFLLSRLLHLSSYQP